VNEEELLDSLFDAVVSGNIQKAQKIAKNSVSQGMSADAAVEKMIEAMRVVDRKYEKKEYFIVDVAASASAMREAFKIFQPHLKVESTDFSGKVVIGSLKGNIQSMGKDIVTATLRAAGLQVADLGVDVSPEAFVEAAVREKAQIIGVSISVDETVPFLEEIVDRLRQRHLREKVKVVIGGRAVSEETRREYGVDAYAEDAWDCVRKVRNLISRSKAISHED
jgi:methanogenic corrinoid protein MtbC1